MTDSLIISKDVRLVPVVTLPSQVRERLDWSEDDVAVTRLRSRTPSKVVSADLAALLNEFQTEKTIIEAVMHYSLVQSVDPRETLDSVFPLLKEFVESGLLISPAHADQEDDEPLQRGETVDVFTLVRRIRTLQDTEIYQAKAPDDRTVALKIAQPAAGRRTDHVLQHEAEVLQALDGRDAPQLLGQGMWGKRRYLAIEWCAGVDVMHAATELRNERDQLLDLCLAILDAYARLHENGVVHGDIHPGNILVDSEGRITLIDFGLAYTADYQAPYRAGVAFYYEPEYAAAFVEKRQPPAANPASEQYALGALLYQLITGATYLNFSLEESVLYRQILDESPRPLAEQGLDPWPAVEAALARALAKDSAERFTDVAAFADALRAAKASDQSSGIEPQHTSPPAPHSLPENVSLLEDVLEALQLDGDLLREGLPRSPYASVNYGAAGIAYALYRMACTRQEPALLALADVWLTRAEEALEDEAGFYNADLDMDVETIGRISPYHTPSGICAVRFLVARAMGDTRIQLEALSGFVAAAGQPCDTLDVTLGKAGVMLTGAMLYEALSDASWAERSGLLTLGNRLFAELWETIEDYASIGSDCELSNLGLAHGWAGVLYGSLRWHVATGAPLPGALPERLAELASWAEETGRGMCWLWDLKQEDMVMPGWCNGSTGQVYLWSLAHRVFGDERYRNLALRAGWNAWEDPAVVATLCCGLAGRSYSLLHLYQLTGGDAWLERAQALATRASHHIRHPQSSEYDGFEMSLYKGELGIALLLSDLTQPDYAVFPFLESEFEAKRLTKDESFAS
jgi:serine/threonine-protein kinase